jgi:cytochrome P450
VATETKKATGKAIPTVSGEMRFSGSTKTIRENRLAFYTRVLDECGGIAKFHWGLLPFYLVSSPELVQAILVEHNKDFNKGVGINLLFSPIVGKGLFLDEGEPWRKQRKLIAPFFQPRHLANYAETIVSYTERQLNIWQTGAVINLEKEMMALTMSIIGKILFDQDVFKQTDELGSALSDAFRWIEIVTLKSLPLPAVVPTPLNLWVRRRMKVIQNHIQYRIEERQKQPTERLDILSMLLNATDENGKHMDQIQVRDEAITLFGAGHETTAVSLSWALYFMLSQPEIYAKAQHEVDTVLAGRIPTVSDLPKLPYILQIIKETLRYYPPTGTIVRQALHKTEIDGYNFLKGQVVLLAMYTTHRIPEYYPDPERFDPERFSVENEAKLPRYAYWPFGAGPRVCIGNHLAMMEMHLILALLVQRIQFDLPAGQNIQVEMRGSIHLNGCQLTVQPRNF